VSHTSELTLRFEECERERLTYKAELRELKTRESRIMGDCAELEDENISLQKQLMQLKQAQVVTHYYTAEIVREVVYMQCFRKAVVIKQAVKYISQ